MPRPRKTNPTPIDIPAVRILPMSNKIPGFQNRTIADVQQLYFLNKLPKNKGRFRYLSSGLNAPPGTVVLFQFQAHIIATAVFERDEKFIRPKNNHAGILHFHPNSFCIFEPIDVAKMRQAWSHFRAFGHAKQRLNPERFPAFQKKLKDIRPPH